MVRRVLEALGLLLALLFLLANIAARAQALHAAGERAWEVLVLGVVLAAALGLARPSSLAPALTLFGASFFLYGFHAYRLPNQAFELLVTALALVLLLRRARRDGALPAGGGGLVLPLFAAYALVATLSLLLLPPVVLEHRLFLEGEGFAPAILGAFPKDPLYPIASVNRLWLFLLFAALLSYQPDARALYRGLFRGIAWAALVAVVLGLLDFLGVFSLAPYNLSHLFYGAQYRRLQSTFGNPSWFACFVSLALPFILLELWEAQRLRRVAIACLLPPCAASLFLSGARASWLAGLVVIASLVSLLLWSGRATRPHPSPGLVVWLALGSAVAAFGVLLATALLTPASPAHDEGSPGRLEGLSQRGADPGSGPHVAPARGGPLRDRAREAEAPAGPRVRELQHAPAGPARHPVLGGRERREHGIRPRRQRAPLRRQPQHVSAGPGGRPAPWASGSGSRSPPRASWPRPVPSVATAHPRGSRFSLVSSSSTSTASCRAWRTSRSSSSSPGPERLRDDARLRAAAPAARKTPRVSLLALGALVLVSAVGYAGDRGYASLKRRFSVPAYLPDEAAEFEGFYRPRPGPRASSAGCPGGGSSTSRAPRRSACRSPATTPTPRATPWCSP